MARSIDSRFYKRKAWIDCRNTYFKYRFGLCERCGSPGEEVHHKIKLNARNVNDPNIAYGFENLELLCKSCHSQITQGIKPRTVNGVMFTEDGDLVKIIT